MAAAYAAAYCEATGVSWDHIDGWTLPHAVARYAEGIEEEHDLLASQVTEALL